MMWTIRNKNRWFTFWLGLILTVTVAVPSYAGNVEKNRVNTSRWVYKASDGTVQEIENGIEPKGDWYRLNADGEVDTGWIFADGAWYFLDTRDGTQKGRMMTGWQWIDGKCYYFAETSSDSYPQGAMYAAGKTPDGYFVGTSGAWLDEHGEEWYVAGRGLSAWGTGQGYQSAGLAGGRKGKHGSGGGGGSKSRVPEGTDKENSTDKENNTGKDHFEEKNDSEKGSLPEKNDNTADLATPSDAKMVSWEVRFIEEKDPNRKILRTQSGKSEEGTELTVDFPEMVQGRDGWQYQALEESPKQIIVSGAGLQKYTVLFRKTDRIAEEPGLEDGEQRLERWIRTAEKADLEITGGRTEDWQVITENQEESRERLRNLVSMAHDKKRHEIYLIARSHNPYTLVIGQEFPNITNISELLMDEFTSLDGRYCVVRIGFQRIWRQESCVHEMDTQELVLPNCMSGGYERRLCTLCGYEETVLFPASGHCDEDEDGNCDVCYQEINDETVPQTGIYREGDIQIRNIGGRQYRFRCIDEDYSDERENVGYAALFLCETVIRSDIESDQQSVRKWKFGMDNNYKTSDVRTWLQKNTNTSMKDVSFVYTGVNTAYQGKTGSGEYEQFTFDDLEEYEKPFQMMEDQLFIFSLEEAVKYRDVLWKFNGSSQNNPQSQYSPYSKGYYLRTPQYEGEDDFQYGKGIYVVDLANGSLHPVDVSDTSIGIRPAFVLKNTENREEEDNEKE